MTSPVKGGLPRESYFLFVIQLLVSVSLVFLPVTEYFSFESSLLHGFVLCLLSGYLFINISDRKGATPRTVLITLFILLIIEPLVRLSQSILSPECSFLHGLKFYLIAVLPASAVSYFLSGSIKILFLKYRYLIFVLTLFGLIIEPLFQFYFLSQIYFYNPILYFFPGTIYDELIRIDSRLIFHRVLTVAGFAVIYFLIKKFNSGKLKYVVFPACVLLYYVTIAPAFGFITTEDALKRNGYLITETENFQIFHPAELTKMKAKELKSFHEFQLAELKEKFDLQAKYKIRSFIYRNSSDKGKLFGSEGADVAKPWKHEIHTSIGSVFGTLRHELAHILGSEFSDPPFYVAGGLNPWLIEGLAVFADYTFDDQDISRLLFSMETISSKSEDTNQGTVSFFRTNTRFAYLKSGLIFNEVQKRFGTNTLKELYRSGNFEAATGSGADDLFKMAADSGASALTPRDSSAAMYYFKSKPYLLKSCPRYLAEEYYQAVQLISQKNYGEAESILKKLMRRSSDNRYIMAYANLLEENQRFKELHEFMEDLGAGNNDINIQLKSMDAKLLAGHPVNYGEYEALLKWSPNLRYDAVLKTRLLFLKKAQLNFYLTGSDSVKKAMIMPELRDSTGFLLLLLNNHSAPEYIMELCQEFPVTDIWTEYVKLLAARRLLQAGERDNFLKCLLMIKSDFLPNGAVYDYEQLIRYSSFIQSENLKLRKNGNQ